MSELVLIGAALIVAGWMLGYNVAAWLSEYGETTTTNLVGPFVIWLCLLVVVLV